MAQSQMRLTGLISGMDTESIVSQLVSVRSMKLKKTTSDQTKLSWKQEIWKDLNSQIKSLVNGTLDNLRYSNAYSKKITEASNSSKVSITTANSAMNTTQTLKINKLANSGYLTGGKMVGAEGKSLTSGSKITDALGVEAGSKISINVGTGADAKTTDIEITEGMTINSFVGKLQAAGVEANFDATNQRLFIGSKKSGSAGDFNITAADANGQDALAKLGLATYDSSAKNVLEADAALSIDGSARDAAIANRVATLTEKYNKQIEDLSSKKSDLETKMTDAAAALQDKYGLDASDSAAMADMKAELEASIARYDELNKKAADGEELTDDEKAELETLGADIDAKREQLSAIEEYEGFKTENGDIDTKLGEAQDKLDNVNSEAIEYVNTLAKKAQDSLAAWDSAKANAAVKIKGEDAEIELNGAKFTSSENTLTVNGLTLELKGTTTGSEVINLTTKQDTSGVYDTIKNFIKEYSTLINKMDKLYGAESADKYDVLTDEEKESLTDTEIDKWETKIKDSLLRRDSILGNASNAMKTIMASSFTVNGKKMYLSDFGIGTLSYFSAPENEKNAYHIDGDEDDNDVKNSANKLKEMITTDPDTVVSFFTQLTNSLYQKMNSLMGSSANSSFATLYDDKKMASEYKDYTSKIAEQEEKLNDYEDKWYKKFAAMEKAMAQMQSKTSAISGIMGNSY